MHRHHGRPLANRVLDMSSSVSTTSTSLPAETAGDAVIADIQEIQHGLANLPQDALNALTAFDQRLQALESMLSSFLSGSGAAPETAVPPVSATDYLPIPAPTLPTSSASSNLCIPPGGAGPLVPCPIPRPTPTSTSTSLHTATMQAPYPVFNMSMIPPGYGSRTAPASMSSTYATGIYPNAPSYQSSYPTAPPIHTGSASSYPPQPSSTSYTFNADADDNVAVYYGTTPATQIGGLLSLCQNPNVDIVILSFIYDFFSQGGYPTLYFGPACTAPSAAQTAIAPGLMNCSALAVEIVGCQRIGKKVLVSLGGAIANSSFTSDDEAEQFAATLWNLFGTGTNDTDLRPFGPGVVIDGFDIDNEDHNTSYYDTFASALRQQYASDPSNTYYLSTTPQCPISDASIPLGAMMQADFVFVQFYNNPSCNLDSDGFQGSFEAWSNLLGANSTTPGKPRVYVGAGAFPGAGSGYVEGDGLAVPIGMARELNTDNLGGMMLWDGSEAVDNVDQYGVNYLEYTKAALQG